MKYLLITRTQFTLLNLLLIGSVFTMVNLQSTYATANMTNGNAIKADIENSLESITENVSSSITDTIDKVVADSLDGMMEDTIDMLMRNATGNNDNNLSDVNFDPKIPSGIDIS
jgi:hypothetical protein